jgi:hypothetical protein
VARRKYCSDAISQAGRGEQPRDPQTSPEEFPIGSEPSAPTAAPRAEYGKPDEPSPQQHYNSTLKSQLDAQRAYAADPVNSFLDRHYSGATPVEREWLKARPHLMQNPALVHAAATVALQHGVPRNSPQFLPAIEHLIAQHVAQHAATQGQPAPPPAPPPPPMPPPMNNAHVQLEHHPEPDEPEEEHPMAAHYSAPVSHGDSGSTAIEPELGPSQVRLSKAEREHAEAAGVSVDEYAKQKLRMQKAKKANLIKD